MTVHLIQPLVYECLYGRRKKRSRKGDERRKEDIFILREGKRERIKSSHSVEAVWLQSQQGPDQAEHSPREEKQTLF